MSMSERVSILFKTAKNTKALFKTYCYQHNLTMQIELDNMLKKYLEDKGILEKGE